MFILKQLNTKHFHSLLVGCTGTGKTIAVQEAHRIHSCSGSCVSHNGLCLLHCEPTGFAHSINCNLGVCLCVCVRVSCCQGTNKMMKYNKLVADSLDLSWLVWVLAPERQLEAWKTLRGHHWPSTCLLWLHQAWSLHFVFHSRSHIGLMTSYPCTRQDPRDHREQNREANQKQIWSWSSAKSYARRLKLGKNVAESRMYRCTLQTKCGVHMFRCRVEHACWSHWLRGGLGQLWGMA